MQQDRERVMKFVSHVVRQGKPVDVYGAVEALRSEFPNLADADLARLVGEEVIAAGACASGKSANTESWRMTA